LDDRRTLVADEGNVMTEFLQKYGPWALIVGASEGLGVTFARELAARGVNLILLARQRALLEALAADMRAEFGVETRVLVQDLTATDVQAQVAAACDGVEVGTMIYNAGAAGGPEALIDQDGNADHPTEHHRANNVGTTFCARHGGAGQGRYSFCRIFGMRRGVQKPVRL
jgi:uncharacterized protein